MAKTKKEPLTYINLLDELVFIKERAKSQNINVTQLKNLKFYKQDIFGKVTLVENFKLNLAKNGTEIIILMLE